MEPLTDSTGQQVPQKQQFAKAFLEIKANVTREDRDNCAKEIKRSKRTVDGYVNGHVYDLTTAVKILNFLKKQIEERAKSLK